MAAAATRMGRNMDRIWAMRLLTCSASVSNRSRSLSNMVTISVASCSTALVWAISISSLAELAAAGLVWTGRWHR